MAKIYENSHFNSQPKTEIITVNDMQHPDWQARLADMKSFRFENDLLPVSVRFDSAGNGYSYWKIIKIAKGYRYSQHIGSSQDMNPDFLMICVKLIYDRIARDEVLEVI